MEDSFYNESDSCYSYSESFIEYDMKTKFIPIRTHFNNQMNNLPIKRNVSDELDEPFLRAGSID